MPQRVPLGDTAVLGVIGSDVAHSLSPLLHNAVYEGLDIDAVYVAFPVADDAALTALAGLRASGVLGVNVTMPHKEAAATWVDTCDPDAAHIASVNTVVLQGRRACGWSTDGQGFLDALRSFGVGELEGALVVLLGAGGAARAVAQALTAEGAQVPLISRRADAASHVVAAGGPNVYRVDSDDVTDVVAKADIVVSAVPPSAIGDAVGDLAQALVAMHGGQLAVDLAYASGATPFTQVAARAGATAHDGLRMLVGQAVGAHGRFFAERGDDPGDIERLMLKSVNQAQ